MTRKLEHHEPTPIDPELAPKLKLWTRKDFDSLPKWQPSARMIQSSGLMRTGILQNTVTGPDGTRHDAPLAQWEYMVNKAGNVVRVVVRSNHLDPKDPMMREYGADTGPTDINILNRKRKAGMLGVFNPTFEELTYAGAIVDGRPDQEKYLEWLTGVINARRQHRHREAQRLIKDTQADKMIKASHATGEAIAERLFERYAEAMKQGPNGQRKRNQAQAD